MQHAFSPVRFHDGQYQAHDPAHDKVGGWRALLSGGAPLRRLVHGWQPTGLYRGFGTVLLLELQHGSGRQATWFLDASQDLIDDDLGRLPQQSLAAILSLAIPALERLRDALLTGNPGPEPLDPLGLHALNQDSIARLVSSAGGLAPAPAMIELGRVPSDQREIVLHGMRLSVAALRDCIAPVLQEQHMTVLAGGAYAATCPFTGHALHTRDTYVDGTLSACRFETPATGLGGPIIYLCNNPVITARELFIPALNCTVAMRAPEQHGLFARLLAAVVKHADLLPAYLAMRKRPVAILTAFPGLHIGHVLWNELTGLDRIRRTLPAGELPMVIVPNAELGTEAFGAVERILPEFGGPGFENRVTRLPADAVAGFVYCEGLTAMRVYDRRVSRHLAERVALVAREDPASQPDQAHAALFRSEGRTVILIGLRVQNRCVPDQLGLWRDLIEHLCHRLGPIAVVIDGINARIEADPSTSYGSFGPHGGRPPVLDELEIVIRLRQHFSGSAVHIVNTVGAPVSRSLFWAQHALFFVAFWGAGLAKYRWVANKPGLVLTNRANLDHPEGDLGIYHSPETMEAPTLLDFIEAEHVTDIGARAGFYDDFTVDPAALLRAVDRLLARVAWLA